MSTLVSPELFRVRVVRAGEAKLRGRVRGVPPGGWDLGLQNVRRRVHTCLVFFVCIHVGFKRFGVFF